MHIDGQAYCARLPLFHLTGWRDNVHMAHTTKPRHFLRQWRIHRGIALEDVKDAAEALFADRVVAEGEEVDLKKIGLSHSTLSRVETFKVPYNQALLEVLAEVYQTDVPSLIIRDPSEPEGIWSIYDKIPVPERQRALKVISGVVEGLKTGTDE